VSATPAKISDDRSVVGQIYAGNGIARELHALDQNLLIFASGTHTARSYITSTTPGQP
jgi:hypothetical protein